MFCIYVCVLVGQRLRSFVIFSTFHIEEDSHWNSDLTNSAELVTKFMVS